MVAGVLFENMTRLRIPERPELYTLGQEVRLRVPLESAPGEMDDRWRRIYNELAKAAGITAESWGTDDRTVLIVKFPIGTPAEDVASALTRAEELLHEADKEREAELKQLTAAEKATWDWCYQRRRRILSEGGQP